MKKRTNEISYWQMPASFRWYRHAVVQVCSQHTLLTSLPPRLVPRKAGLRVGGSEHASTEQTCVAAMLFPFQKNTKAIAHSMLANPSRAHYQLLNWITGVFWVLKCDLEIYSLYPRIHEHNWNLLSWGIGDISMQGCDVQTQSKRLPQTTYTGLFVPHKTRP